jgi:uncharacterized protein (TIRG00374 family)
MPLVGIAAFLVYLYLFKADIPEIIATIQAVDTFIYSMTALLIFIDTFFYAMAWRTLLAHLSVKLSVFKAYLYVWYGTFMDLIIPAESISGEISRVYLVARDHGNEVNVKVVASLITHRLINMGISLATLIVGVNILLTRANLNNLILNLSLFLGGTTTFFLVLLSLICVKKEWVIVVINHASGIIEWMSKGKWKFEKVKKDVAKAAEVFHSSMMEFSHSPKVVALSMFLSGLSWLSYLAISYMVFMAIRFPTNFQLWGAILVTQAIITAVKSIPVGVPFEVGLPEITMTTLYAVLGIPLNVSITATILTRVLTVWLRLFVGFAVQEWIEIKTVRASLRNS